MTVAHVNGDRLRLVADVGGTNGRFALARGRTMTSPIEVFQGDDFADLRAMIETAIAVLGGERPAEIGLAIATPIVGDDVRMTNRSWSFSIRRLREQLGASRLVVLNDFVALALALPSLDSHEVRAIGGGHPHPGEPIGVIGPGTGLGVGGLLAVGEEYVPIPSEGGHASLSPADEDDARLLATSWAGREHVSWERLVSGPGLVRIHEALPGPRIDHELVPELVTANGLASTCARCVATLERFCALLGSAAGNLALTLGARGGVYVGGGIVPRLGDFFERSAFRARFEAKGRFESYLAAIPTYVIDADQPALRGVVRALASPHLIGCIARG